MLKDIEFGYTLEPSRRSGSNEYPQSMSWVEIWKMAEFLSENFQFLVLKFSKYLNMRVFVMHDKIWRHRYDAGHCQKISPISCISNWWQLAVTQAGVKRHVAYWEGPKYSRLSLSRSPRDFLKYWISEPRNIWFAEWRKKINRTTTFHKWICNLTPEDLFVLRFYGPVNPMWSCRARSVYLTTRLLGRLSPQSG